MAENSLTDRTGTGENRPTFKDPLHVNDPLLNAIDDAENDAFDIEINTSTLKIDEDDIDEAFKKNAPPPVNHADDELENETKDLFVVVDNPEKHTTTMESYITFRIVTKTSRAEYDSHEYQVRRRYNDFLWLRQRLDETQATHLIPPLPEKHSLRRFDRFSPEFVKTRQKALQVFLSRIADHPVLSFNKHFQIFLTAKQWEFQAHKKEGSGFLSRMSDSLHNYSASYMMKNRPTEFTVMGDYIQAFGEKLGTLDRISQRILKEETDYLTELNEWGPVFTLWSNSEDKLSQALAAMAKAIEKDYLALENLVDTGETDFGQSIKEYMLHTESVKSVLRKRDAIQAEYETAVDDLTKRKEEKDQEQVDQVTIAEGTSLSFSTLLGKDPDEIKKEKHAKLDVQIQELTQKVEELNDKTVCADSDLKADMERWHKTKRKDFRKLFMEMSDRHIDYYKTVLNAWEEAIPLIQKSDKAAENLFTEDNKE